MLRNNSGEIKRLPAVSPYGSIRKELWQEAGTRVRRREDYDTEVLSDIMVALWQRRYRLTAKISGRYLFSGESRHLPVSVCKEERRYDITGVF